MQRKRFKLVKPVNDPVKPLQPKSTNVERPSVDARVKQPLKRSREQDSQQTKKRKKESHATTDDRGETIFENDHVQLKFGEPSPRAVSPPQRLLRVEEEEEEGNSLQLDDFDQPPESTSTPVHSSKGSGRGSPLIYNGFIDDFSSRNKYLEQQQQQQQQMLSYMPFEFIPQYQFPPTFPVGYNNGTTPVQTIGPSMGPQFPIPMGYPMNCPLPQPPMMVPYMRNYVYGPASQTSSYKSSGGDATYRGSEESGGR